MYSIRQVCKMTDSELRRRWNFLRYEDIGAVSDLEIAARLGEILAIENEIKSRWNQDEPSPAW